jgi:membrane-associated phospholipid phosphatase
MNTRRGLLSILVLMSLALLTSASNHLVAQTSSVPAQTSFGLIEPEAGTWKTWVLASGSQFRLPPPPDSAATRAEIDELQALASQRDAAARDRITFWNAGAPSYRWVEVALERILKGPVRGLNASRHVALVNVAMYDATIAAWDSKYAYNRPRPSEFDPALSSALPNPRSPSYPSDYAATAGAASAVLAYLFPDDAKLFTDQAEEAARSRILAGVEYPSDVRAGLELGRTVAARVIERAKADGFDASWTGTVPTGSGFWNGTNPMFPSAGTWKTWVLAPANQFRPGPPPAYDSPQKAAELAELKSFPRTFETNQKAFFAQTGDGIFALWYHSASQWMFEDRLDDNAPWAARAYALMSVAHHDSMVACWDAKYAYWAIRPFQLDPEVKTLFPTPNHPSYPAAHGCGSGAIAAVMAYLFPRRADFITAKADEMAWSRLWAGIHYRSDIEAGLALGRSVAQVVIERAKGDGAP